MSYILELDIPRLPKLQNQMLRGHWRVRYGHNRLWKRLVFSQAWHLKPPRPLLRADITLTRHSAREPDFDGLVASFKPCLDALVQAKIIIDDKPSIIGQPKYLWQKAKPKQGKITITVKECA